MPRDRQADENARAHPIADIAAEGPAYLKL
jgi:hypothetical protein